MSSILKCMKTDSENNKTIESDDENYKCRSNIKKASKAQSICCKQEKCRLMKCSSAYKPGLNVDKSPQNEIDNKKPSSVNTLLEFKDEGLNKNETRLDINLSNKYGLPHCGDLNSEYGDLECGEPMTAQHLILDFTPEEGLDDNNEILDKCYDFWALFRSKRELHKLVVEPELEIVEEEEVPYEYFEQPDLEVDDESTAYNWLQSNKITNAGLATNDFRICSTALMSYQHGSEASKASLKKIQEKQRFKRKKKEKDAVNAIRGECLACQNETLPDFSPPYTKETKKVFKQMESFNLNNPKDFSPPCRPKWNCDV